MSDISVSFFINNIICIIQYFFSLYLKNKVNKNAHEFRLEWTTLNSFTWITSNSTSDSWLCVPDISTPPSCDTGDAQKRPLRCPKSTNLRTQTWWNARLLSETICAMADVTPHCVYSTPCLANARWPTALWYLAASLVAMLNWPISCLMKCL